MLAFTDVSTLRGHDRPAAGSRIRRLEAEVLMQAITALHLADLLTDAEYEAKLQRLAARL
ncbi:MAG: hypothetical protein ABJH68_16260 [Ilumatobacter sp.]|uniref:hypothetical protein n=1 Tax=Ilumatobacter sp. TaxID=1967498 RepID=UPI003298BCDD